MTRLRQDATAAGLHFRYVDACTVGIALDETTTAGDVTEILAVCAGALDRPSPAGSTDAPEATPNWPGALIRQSPFLTHPVFARHRSETQMMRYLKRLERKDVGLDTSMIPLGSCTMKLTAAAQIRPVTWPEFGEVHPFAPVTMAEGYQELFRELEASLCAITGFSAVSLQPNSGAQGEFAGLMVIRAYHRDQGAQQRDVVLIPASAHGTNPASASMAGMRVVIVGCDEAGNVDLGDLRAKAETHRDALCALMVTYPSTHGVFEDAIREICDIVHGHGGQVYMDGANMNAQVGVTSPAAIGADVCHINLHKTFAIPHGGGGPGMGPIGVAAHLAPYLPGHPLVRVGGDKGIPAIAAAPWGSASILLISYGYMRMLGGEGMRRATEVAMLSANYLKVRLESHYDVLYARANGRVAHELIFDLRAFKPHGVTELDVAKRLMDYGFHAPTVSFPVPGTMMVEPTESEPRDELDRFCEALIAIRAEIQEVLDGAVDPTDNVLRNAPHTAAEATADTWSHPYTREQAVYPRPFVRANKFWPSVGRINDTHGDRHLVCSCPPVEAYGPEGEGWRRVGRTGRVSPASVQSSVCDWPTAAEVRVRRSASSRKRVSRRDTIGPGRPDPIDRSPTRTTGTTSRVVLVMNSSSTRPRSSSRSTASRTGTPMSAPTSNRKFRVTPSRSPASSGGVSTTSSRTANRFDCEHSASSPRWFSRIAS